MADIEFFYAAHSAFAYLGFSKLVEIANASGRAITHKPVCLGEVVAAARSGGFSGRSGAHRDYYFGREIERWAEHRNVAVKGGIPVNHSNDITLANTMIIAALSMGHNVDSLAHSIMEAHWLYHADLAENHTLHELAQNAGLDPDALLRVATSSEVKAAYEANTAEAIDRSVFGSPTYVVDGDMFYGQDHLELVARAIRQPYANTWPTTV